MNWDDIFKLKDLTDKSGAVFSVRIVLGSYLRNRQVQTIFSVVTYTMYPPISLRQAVAVISVADIRTTFVRSQLFESGRSGSGSKPPKVLYKPFLTRNYSPKITFKAFLWTKLPVPVGTGNKYRYVFLSRDAPDTVFAGYPAGGISG
jgi:hypothetical protein